MRMPILIAALLLAGCASQTTAIAPPAGAPQTDPIAQIAKFTVDDLQAADKIAVDAGDDIGHACFPALTRFVQSMPSSLPTTTVAGAFSAFETARTTRIKVQGAIGSGIPSYLKLGCAALVQDEAAFITKLAAIGGGSAVLGPLAPGLAPLINSVLPIPLP